MVVRLSVWCPRHGRVSNLTVQRLELDSHGQVYSNEMSATALPSVCCVITYNYYISKELRPDSDSILQHYLSEKPSSIYIYIHVYHIYRETELR